MLQIKDIRKQYVTGDLVQTALDGVSLNLRENEFVAILGPSGSGKTTLLNVIGGLDRYDSGDLIINGISTKKYTDRDWDSYRNHTIGFVFQSYNLIPHQSVLANVELALTISGISRSERRKRAVKALEDVGLGNQLHKRPNQMSGGQMQRVAIARALVNNPDILLADEPTGALDSETSVQVMELLKEVSKNRLVVMVTHNPELAEEYANRIVRVKDGRIISDTNPFLIDEAILTPPEHKNMGKASMSFFTALSLSFNNLRTKLARTLLTAFAGSIGIIGIALIMSLSTGFQKYIDKIQADTLSNYPLTIQTETADMGSMMMAMGNSFVEAKEAEPGTLVEQQMITQMFAQISANDLASFKKHLETHYDEIGHTINSVQYHYGIKPRIFLENTDKGILQANPGTIFAELMGNSMMAAYMDSDVFHEMMDNQELLDSQYEVLRGRWPGRYDELVVVLQDPNQITDYMAYTLGLKDKAVLDEVIQQVMEGVEPDDSSVNMKWTYDDLMNLKLRLVPVSELYRYNEEYNVWEDMTGDQAYMAQRINDGEELEIVGIVCPKEGVSATALTTGICYTTDLTRHVIEAASGTRIVQDQLADENINVFTGKPFGDEEGGEMNFQDMISVDSDAISSAFGMDISTDAILNMLEKYMKDAMSSVEADTKPAQQAFVTTLAELSREMLQQYIGMNADETGKASISLTDAEPMVSAYLASDSAKQKIQELADSYGLPAESFVEVYQPLMVGMVTTYVASEMMPQDTAAVQAAPISLVSEVDDQTPPTNDPQETAPSDDTETTPPGTGAGDDDTSEEPPADSDTEENPDIPSVPDETLPSVPDIDIDLDQFRASIAAEQVDEIVNAYMSSAVVNGTSAAMASKMMESTIMDTISKKIGQFTSYLMRYMGSSFRVDTDKLASAFQFNMNEEELQRLMQAMSGQNQQATAAGNLRSLGYADLEDPASMYIYLLDFAAKEEFMAFLDAYNEEMEAAEQEDKVIRYTDVTGIMMSSVRTIIDSVSYALIAFVAVSLVVSSIMIGIITYISVMERTKEIGVLRAIGASKRNITQVFNAETFIIGLCSGLIGIGITLLILIPGNQLIQHLTNNPDIVAQLPVANAAVLILLSMLLTLIGGFIPAKQAAKKDPVIALRSE